MCLTQFRDVYTIYTRPLPVQKQLYSNLQTRPLVRKGVTNLQNRKCRKEISRRKKNWSQVPDGRLTPGQTGRLTVGRKLTHSLTPGSVQQIMP
jgi:hypothetical protein